MATTTTEPAHPAMHTGQASSETRALTKSQQLRFISWGHGCWQELHMGQHWRRWHRRGQAAEREWWIAQCRGKLHRFAVHIACAPKSLLEHAFVLVAWHGCDFVKQDIMTSGRAVPKRFKFGGEVEIEEPCADMGWIHLAHDREGRRCAKAHCFIH